jgi:hypothetical protein
MCLKKCVNETEQWKLNKLNIKSQRTISISMKFLSRIRFVLNFYETKIREMREEKKKENLAMIWPALIEVTEDWSGGNDGGLETRRENNYGHIT